MFKSLRGRLIASFVFVILLSLLLGFLTLVVVVRPIVTRLAYSTLIDRAIPTSRLVGELLRTGDPIPELKAELVDQAEQQQVRILVAELRGDVLVDTGGELEGQRLLALSQTQPDPATRYLRGTFDLPNGERQLYTGIPVPAIPADAGIQRPVMLVLAMPARGMWGFLRELIRGFLWAGLVTVIVAAVLALLLTRSLSSPVGKIAKAAHAIAQGDYDQRLEIDYPSEMREVAVSFSQMAGDVKQSRHAMEDFVANVSHELKTPLTSVRGFAEAILDDATGGEEGTRHAAGIIRDESMRMTRMVEQLLELSKIESGQSSMARNPVRVEQVLKACVDRMSIAAKEKGVRLTADCPPLPAVLGDGDRLAQVFINLLDNALKHTPADGKVSAVARLAYESVGERQQAFAEVSITDTGPGIPADELDRVFERFYQVDKSRARKTGGAGLGLAISKSIVDLHGGRIWAESVEGLGSKFVVRLPVEG